MASICGLAIGAAIRTIIQHAWSAVSHALHYKNEYVVPSKLQRRLFRIAGLFELADEEFLGIRNERTKIQENASDAIDKSINLPLSKEVIFDIINKHIDKNAIIDAFDGSNITIYNEDDDAEDHESISDILDLCIRNNIKSTKELITMLDSINLSFAFKPGKIWSGSSLRLEFIIYMLLLERLKEHIDLDYLIGRGWEEGIARKLLKNF